MNSSVLKKRGRSQIMEASAALLNDGAQSQKVPSPAPKNDNQITDNPVIVDDTAIQADIVPLDEDDRSSSKALSRSVTNAVKSDNQHESSIIMKRCKHGRIIIKDLSKKKFAQPSDNGANTVTNLQNDESNNNHIVSRDNSTNDNETGNEYNQTFLGERLSAPNDDQTISQVKLDNDLSSGIKCTQEQLKTRQQTPPIELVKSSSNVGLNNPISTLNGINSRNSSRLIFRAKAKSRSSSKSHSPSQSTSDTKGSPKRSRYGRSPTRKDTNSSRNRTRSSHKKRDSHSPKRRASASRKRDRRSPSRHRRRSPDRHKHSASRRHRRRSPSSRSPSRSARSRSITPPQRRLNINRHNRRKDSRSPSRDRPRYDRYSHADRERSKSRFEKSSHKHSPEYCRSLGNTENPSARLTNQSDKDNQAVSKPTQSNPKSSLGQLLPEQQLPVKKLSPKSEIVDASPPLIHVAHAPTTPPSNDESALSDIYDPEAPIIPISPGDSPPSSPALDAVPIKPVLRSGKSEKSGEDDVPSSAVQLNQQEKYLQKLNRQERVIEEVKVALRPFYQNRSIDKEQYKDVLRRAVPKVCHSKNGEINPIKIRALVDAYVKKMKRH